MLTHHRGIVISVLLVTGCLFPLNPLEEEDFVAPDPRRGKLQILRSGGGEEGVGAINQQTPIKQI